MGHLQEAKYLSQVRVSLNLLLHLYINISFHCEGKTWKARYGDRYLQSHYLGDGGQNGQDFKVSLSYVASLRPAWEA